MSSIRTCRADELDLIDSIPLVEVKGPAGSEYYRVSMSRVSAERNARLNVTRPPFDNEKLRQAVDRLVDREAVAKAALRNVGGDAGQLALASSPWPHGRERRVSTAQRREAEAAAEEAGSRTGSRSLSEEDPLPTQPADRTDY